jgi:hypothetical protein
LAGSNLFLVTAVAGTPDMSGAVDVPAELTGTAISVPNTARPGANGATATLYLRLRDDPATVQMLNLAVSPMTNTAVAADSQDSGSSTATSGAVANPAVPTGTDKTGSDKPAAPSDGSAPSGQASQAAPSVAQPKV